MKIRVKPSRRRLDRVTLNLASMVDVIFLLLIYFMVTTVLARPEDRLSPALQTQDDNAAAPSDFQPQIVQVVMIDDAPAYRIGDRVLHDRRALLDAMRLLHQPSGIFIQVQDRVPVGFAVAAVQTARDAGFEQVTYVPDDQP